MSNYLPTYNFPPTIFSRENTGGQQLDHVMSEVDEIREAVEDPSSTHEEMIEEVIDLVHSLETFLRILELERGREYLQERFDQVKQKNAARGYYDGMEDWI